MTVTTDEIGQRIADMCGDISGITTATNDWNGSYFDDSLLPYIIVLEAPATFQLVSSSPAIVREERNYFVVLYHALITREVAKLDVSARVALRPFIGGGGTSSIPAHFAKYPKLSRSGSALLDDVESAYIASNDELWIAEVGTKRYSAASFSLLVTTRWVST